LAARFVAVPNIVVHRDANALSAGAFQPGLRSAVISGFAEPGFVDTIPRGTPVPREPVQRNVLLEVVHGLMHHDRGD
jgi:hypothetical protein